MRLLWLCCFVPQSPAVAIFWSRSAPKAEVDIFVPPFAGVGKADAARYTAANESGILACANGIVVPVEQINDDFCDCPDGYDEPGTSACPKGRFYCVNSGHRSVYIPSSRVRDAICDCCDGSDEADTAEVSCPNTCAQAHAAWSRQHADVVKELEAGAKAKDKYAIEGQAAAAARRGKIEAAQKEVEQISEKLAAAQAEQAAAVAVEAEEKSAKLAVAEEIVRKSLGVMALSPEIIQNLAVDVASHEHGAGLLQGLLDDLRGGLDADEAVSAFEKKLKGESEEKSDQESAEEDGGEPDDVTGELDDENWMPKDDGYDEEPYAAGYSEDDDVDMGRHDDGGEGNVAADKALDDGGDEEETEKQPSSPPARPRKTFAYKSEAAEAARARVRDVQAEERRAKQVLQDLEEEATLDYGEAEQFQPLKGKCFSLKVGQYTYEMCPYGEARQKEAHGSGVKLGDWQRISQKGAAGAAAATGEDTLDSSPTLDSGLALEFEGGARCWNGPERSLKVQLLCGQADKVVSVEEPETCTYVMVFATPAACDGAQPARPGADEPAGAAKAHAGRGGGEYSGDDDDYEEHVEL